MSTPSGERGTDPREHGAIKVRALGEQPYTVVWERMKAFTEARTPRTADECWWLTHASVYTLGVAGNPGDLLAPSDVPLVRSDRGGQITWHGPGQLVCYLLLDLRRAGLGVKALVCAVEQSVIDLLGDYGLKAFRRPGAPGVYLASGKIAALGLRVRRGCSYHGVSLNVSNDLAAFARINPCGYAGMAVTRLADEVVSTPSLDAVARGLIDHLAQRLGRTTAWQ